MFEENSEVDNTLDMNNFSLGALTIEAHIEKRTSSVLFRRLLRLLSSSKKIETTPRRPLITEEGQLNITLDFHDQLGYFDYDMFIRIHGFEAYDSTSDLVLSLDKEEKIQINNSGKENGVAGAIGSTKDSVEIASDLIGMALLIANPATAGVFVQLTQVLKLIDKL